MQHLEQRKSSDDEGGKRSRATVELREARAGYPPPMTRKQGIGAAWLGVGAGLGAMVAPQVIASLARTRLRGTDRALAMAVGAVATAAAVKFVDGLLVSRQNGVEPRSSRAVTLRASITISRSPGEVYRFWRTLENLPLFMAHLESVREVDGESLWCAKGPLGASLEWQARISEDTPEERIAWQSLEGSTLPNYGKVEFREEPAGVGTEVHVELSFEPPGGAVGAALVRLFDELPEQWLRNDLRRLKQILETGEVVRSDASIHRGRHPARPPEADETTLARGTVLS
jgi:uncharacterized membrane protein